MFSYLLGHVDQPYVRSQGVFLALLHYYSVLGGRKKRLLDCTDIDSVAIV